MENPLKEKGAELVSEIYGISAWRSRTPQEQLLNEKLETAISKVNEAVKLAEQALEEFLAKPEVTNDEI